MSDNGVNKAEAGWYPDPQEPSLQRWWDGSQWSNDTQGVPGTSLGGGQPVPDGETAIKDWAGIFWLGKKNIAWFSPVGVLSLEGRRMRFATKKGTLFDVAVEQGEYSIGTKFFGSPLIVQVGEVKYKLFGALSQGPSPSAEMVEAVARIRKTAADRARAGSAGMAVGLGVGGILVGLATGITGAMGAGAVYGQRNDLINRVREAEAFRLVLENNGVTVDTAKK